MLWNISDASLGTEELGHLEMICAMVHQLTRNLTEQQIIDLAKKDVTVEYNQTSARFDTEKGLWTVSFSKKNTAGGDQVFAITHEGKIIDVEYGE